MSLPYQLRQEKAVEKYNCGGGKQGQEMVWRGIVIGDVFTWLTLRGEYLVDHWIFKSDTQAQEFSQVMEKVKPQAEMIIVCITLSYCSKGSVSKTSSKSVGKVRR